jgi:hypothetical protein
MKPLLLRDSPTAVQEVIEVQDTPLRKLLVGVGVAWIAQALPFQLSARVARTPLPLTE